MLYKTCELCGKSFECFSDADNCWCSEYLIDIKKLSKISNYGKDCYCQNCLYILKNNGSNENKTIKIRTTKDEMKLSIKRKGRHVVISIHNKDYHYPLFTEKFQNSNEAILKFFQYRVKLENDQFKIIRNIEALDENYRRVFSRVKYSILF